MKGPFEKLTDAELMQRYVEGDEAAFPEIVNRYKNSLYAFLKRFLNHSDLVDDVFQETFLQLFTSRESFDPNRPLQYAGNTTTPGKPGRMTVIQGLYADFRIPGFLMEQRIAFNPKLGRLPRASDRIAFGAELVKTIATVVSR